ncbi:hypothetical protein ACOSQ4_031029 [Xanthoceras sorbifolium]
MGKSSSPERNNNNGVVKKGPWTVEEDQKLTDYIQKHGHGRWRILPKNAGLKRCGKSCRLRWTNYLRPDIKRGKFSLEEEETIIQLHRVLGNKWSAIAARLPGRTDNEIKNYWNTHIKKKLLRMGIDPVTHSPRLDLLELSSILMNNSSLCNSQINPLNPDFFNLATTLLSTQTRPPFNPHNNLQQSLLQYQYPVQACTNIPTTSQQAAQFLNQSQFTQANLEQFCPNPTSFDSDILPNYVYDLQETTHDHHINQSRIDSSISQNQSYLYNIINDEKYVPMNRSFGSLLSEPSSSSTPLNSSSTNYVNGGTEDERDSYCSNALFDSLDGIGLV